jgi:TolB-like protein
MDSSDHITLAVFPFEDLSLKKDLNIFCRAFSEDLVTELSKFRHFQMISCPNYISTTDTSSLKLFDGSEPDYFIQGSFRYEKDPVRINIQLYNSHTLHLVWGNRLEGKLTDLGEIQENLLTEVVGVLQQQINTICFRG